MPVEIRNREVPANIIPTAAVERSSMGLSVVTVPPDRPRGIALWFLCGATPSAAGADQEVCAVPYHPVSGDVINFAVRRMTFRTETAGTTYSAITLQKSKGAGAFEAVTLASLVLAASANSATLAEVAKRVKSGDLLRCNIDTIGSGAQKWSLLVELGEIAEGRV